MLAVTLCGVGGLVLPLMVSPMVYTHGLCGLSSIDHGLMAYWALEMMSDKTTSKFGAVCLLGAGLKSLVELLTGKAMFSYLLFGFCGVPIAGCHAGGFMGGVFSFFLVYCTRA